MVKYKMKQNEIKQARKNMSAKYGKLGGVKPLLRVCTIVEQGKETSRRDMRETQ